MKRVLLELLIQIISIFAGIGLVYLVVFGLPEWTHIPIVCALIAVIAILAYVKYRIYKNEGKYHETK